MAITTIVRKVTTAIENVDGLRNLSDHVLDQVTDLDQPATSQLLPIVCELIAKMDACGSRGQGATSELEGASSLLDKSGQATGKEESVEGIGELAKSLKIIKKQVKLYDKKSDEGLKDNF